MSKLEIAKPAPQSRWQQLKFLGPSFAVTAITIGSGELIATTAAGARVGIVALWFIMFSIIIKVGIQYQFAKHVLVEEKRPHEVFDEIPGEIYGHSWAWWWIVAFWLLAENFQYMGIFFGIGVLLHYVTLQTIPISISLLIVLVITIVPALRGYDFVEDFATIMVGILTVVTITAAILTFFSPFGLTTDQIVYGLSFNLPSGGLITLFGTVGVTGMAANELIGYSLYSQETGYGELAGPSDSDGWQERMEGWLQVMRLDVVVSLLIMLITTVAFFIIGATVVNSLGNYPSGPQLAVFLANAYGQIFGTFGYWLLLIGGFFALYSTAFGQIQLISVAYPDWASQTEWGNNINEDRFSTFLVIALPIIWYIGGFIIGEITAVIIIAGVFIALSYFPVIIAAGWTLRTEQNEFQSTGLLRYGVWISIIGSFLVIAVLVLITRVL